MVLESTVICVDNSEYMRNSDFLPTRLQAQQDAVSLVTASKCRSNPENNVALISMSSNPTVVTTLTSDAAKIMAKLSQVAAKGNLDFVTAVRIAHLTLKHRQGKMHRMRIVIFVGSPIESDPKEMTKLAKRLKKEKVNVDVVNFGENVVNTEVLEAFIATVNGKDGAGSHMVTVPSGPHLTDALVTSPVVQGEDGQGGSGLGGGGGFDPFDPNDDPELAIALRVSMEEQRQRIEPVVPDVAAAEAADVDHHEEGAMSAGLEDELLQQALSQSMGTHDPSGNVDFASMTEDEQIAYALQMSMAHENQGPEEDMDVDEDEKKKEEEDKKKEEEDKKRKEGEGE